MALLEAMSRETVDQQKALQPRPFSQNGVSVKAVDIIQPGPSANYLKLIKGWYIFNQFGPHKFVELMMIPREVTKLNGTSDSTIHTNVLPCDIAGVIR